MNQNRYVLLCRHASHDGGELTPNKDDNGVWRFPTESVAGVLAEEMVIGRDGLRLAKVVHAPTPEASRTAKLLLKGLNGERRKANDKPPAQPETLSGGYTTIAAPDWLPEADRKPCLRPGAYGYIVPYERWDELAPNRLDRTSEDALGRVDEEIKQLNDRNALLIVGHQPQMGWLSSTSSVVDGDCRVGRFRWPGQRWSVSASGRRTAVGGDRCAGRSSQTTARRSRRFPTRSRARWRAPSC